MDFVLNVTFSRSRTVKYFCSSLDSVFSCTIWCDVKVALSQKLIPRECVGMEARGERTKGRISPDLCKPKSGNTQLDECLLCQQLQRKGCGPGSDMYRRPFSSQRGLVCVLPAGMGTSHPGMALSYHHPVILKLFTSGVNGFLRKDLQHASFLSHASASQ